MRIPILLVCLAAVGCGKKPPPLCDAVADRVHDLNGGGLEDYAVGLGKVFENRCLLDTWSDEMRRCILATRSLVEPKNCKQKLTPDQLKNFDADLVAFDERMAMKTIPGACVRYEKLLAGLSTCDVLPKEGRDQLQGKFDKFKATWPTVKDKRTLESTCGSAIKTVKGIAANCPGAATW